MPWLDRVSIRVPVRIGDRAERVRLSNAAEMLVLKEVLVERIYDVDVESPVGVVLDLGANVGVASLHFQERWPEARIIAVEPDPTTARKLRANVAAHPQVEVVEAAVVAVSTPTVEFVADASSWESRVAGAGEQGTITVPALTLEELLTRFGLDRVDVLKIDIEGMEYEVLSKTTVLDRVGLLVGEVHPNGDPRGEADLLDGLVRRGWQWVQPFERSTFCLRAPA